jgi:bifunctional non-homologous end joining protein LigD
MPPRSPATFPKDQPIAPVLRGVPFDDPAWLFEPKYDGFRGLLYVRSGDVYFRSKRRNVMTRFQPLAKQVRDALRVRSAILDGEIVSLDEEGRHIFRRMLAGKAAVCSSIHFANSSE